MARLRRIEAATTEANLYAAPAIAPQPSMAAINREQMVINDRFRDAAASSHWRTPVIDPLPPVGYSTKLPSGRFIPVLENRNVFSLDLDRVFMLVAVNAS